MKPTYHIISHSHWDREWYFPFERFRAMLVDMIEDLLLVFEKDPEFLSYTLDGQMAAVVDYLEVRPDRKETIRQLVESGKLFIGPWYILNDEFLSSGESHIRNLMLGFKLGNPLGGVMKVGYIPDQFGHIAQMPQILRGFGIEDALIYRGFGGEQGQESSEYWWVSPDGTNVLMHHLPKDGYSAGYFGTGDEQTILQKFGRLQKELDSRATTSHRLFFNGGDHHWPDADVTTALRVLRKNSDFEFRHSNFADFFSAIRKELGKGDKLPRLEGETRFGYRHAFAVLGGVFSSRMYLKQQNTECEAMLERIVEPLNVLASGKGMRSKTPQMEQAWKYVLQNQDHDAICGTSVDEVHREMTVRYAKAKQIGEHVKAECFATLFPYDEQAHKDDRYLFIFNPSPFPRSEIVETTVEFYLQDIVVGLNPEVKVGEKLPPVSGFTLADAAGRSVPYQILRREEAFGVTYSKKDYPHQTLVDRFTVLVSAEDLPPMGWNGLRIVTEQTMPEFPSAVSADGNSIENDFLKAEVQRGGWIKLTEKATGSQFESINLFEDSGDVGDEYNYSYPERDEIILSDTGPVSTVAWENGPLRASITLEYRMSVPVSASQDERARSGDRTDLVIRTTLSLTKFSKRLDFKTSVTNTVKDHRLRVFFKTGIVTKESHAETPFAIVKREHRLYDTAEFPYEHPALVAPMRRFVMIRDQKRGFTVMGKGLPEYELKLNEPGTLALTLLRCVGKLSGRDLLTRPGGAAGWWNETPDAQCLGEHVFEYSVVPHFPEDEALWPIVLGEAESFTVPLLAISRKNEQDIVGSSFVSVQPLPLVLSALKIAETGESTILRLNNPTALPINGQVLFNDAIKEAFRVKMNEKIVSELNVKEGREINLTVKPYEVVTVLVRK